MHAPLQLALPETPAARRLLWRAGRVLGAAGLTALLAVFLVAARWFDSARVPERLIRPVETVPEVALPAPPPPPPSLPDEPPPPPPPARLPRLEIQLEQSAPALAASMDRRPDLTMETAEFALELAPPAPPDRPPAPLRAPSPAPRPPSSSPAAAMPRPQARSSVSAGELDAKPRLLNRPSAAYPTGLLRQGVKEGRVLLEVAISPSGGVTVRRVISRSHPEFEAMARSFASRARFSPPKKDGQPVTAIYQWPLILRP